MTIQNEDDPGALVRNIARLAHEVNRAYCESLGDYSQPVWEDAPDWQQSSAIDGVVFHLDNPDAKPSHSHDAWLEFKKKNGWKFGPVKDEKLKEHPCMVPYDQLPQEQKSKDFLFRGVVHAFIDSAILKCEPCWSSEDQDVTHLVG